MEMPGTYKQTQESPATNSFAITPHDTDEVGSFLPRAIYVGGAGNIVMQLLGDTASVTFVGVIAGTILPVRPSIVLDTGTTATNLVALY